MEKFMTFTQRGVFISYVYASLLSAVIDEWEKINEAKKARIMAGRGADC